MNRKRFRAVGVILRTSIRSEVPLFIYLVLTIVALRAHLVPVVVILSLASKWRFESI